MNLSALFGNAQIKNRLSAVTDGQTLSHAYLIAGPSGSGRHTLATLLAQTVLCTASTEHPCGVCGSCKKVAAGIHPDFKTVAADEPEKPIPVEQIRILRSDAHVRPNEGTRKIYLLSGADRMNQSAQNAMLKLLEDGPHYTMFLLLAENSGTVLETVRSRCELFSLVPLSVPECVSALTQRFPDHAAETLRAAADEAQGLLGRAIALLDGSANDDSALRALAEKIVCCIEGGDELALFEACIPIEGLKKDGLLTLFQLMTTALVGKMAHGGNDRQLLSAIDLIQNLRAAALLNANAGQLSGWLCAALSEKRFSAPR